MWQSRLPSISTSNMRTIIAGSRSCINERIVFDAAYNLPWLITEVVSGTCHGPDQYGISWAITNEVPIKRFPANWPKFGRGAGYNRNIEMANYAEALLAIWDGVSRGTGHMIDTARKLGMPTKVVLI